jgi:hypothetical protein
VTIKPKFSVVFKGFCVDAKISQQKRKKMNRYYDKDADLNIIKGMKVAIVGYGYKIVKLVKNGVLMIIHIYAKVSNILFSDKHQLRLF